MAQKGLFCERYRDFLSLQASAAGYALNKFNYSETA
jgi:hypothetical protein